MKDYMGSLIKALMDSEYQFLGLSDGKEAIEDDTAFMICAKPVPPVLYVVNIINTSAISPEGFEQRYKGYMEKIRENKGKTNCSFAVDVNILVGKNIDSDVVRFIDSKYYDVTEKDHSIWWAADLTARRLINGKNMPDNIGGIRAVAEKAFGKKTESSIADMEKEVKRDRERRRKTSRYTVTYALIAVTLIAFVITVIFGGEQSWAYAFGNDHNRIVLYGEYYRLITCMFIHAGFVHIGYNCISLYVFGTRAERYIGHIAFLLLYFGAGLSGSILSFLFTRGLSVGASGAVYGAVGAVFALNVFTKKSVGGISYMAMLLFIITGLGMGALGGNVDNFAHIGGFIFGFLYTYIYLRLTNRTL